MIWQAMRHKTPFNRSAEQRARCSVPVTLRAPAPG